MHSACQAQPAWQVQQSSRHPSTVRPSRAGLRPSSPYAGNQTGAGPAFPSTQHHRPGRSKHHQVPQRGHHPQLSWTPTRSLAERLSIRQAQLMIPVPGRYLSPLGGDVAAAGVPDEMDTVPAAAVCCSSWSRTPRDRDAMKGAGLAPAVGTGSSFASTGALPMPGTTGMEKSEGRRSGHDPLLRFP